MLILMNAIWPRISNWLTKLALSQILKDHQDFDLLYKKNSSGKAGERAETCIMRQMDGSCISNWNNCLMVINASRKSMEVL